ncbi:MAG: hypothetical protein K6F79_07610 [Saccharofermentans sp.]|nr:hypothetical protein [Saccharofermentans sp.]
MSGRIIHIDNDDFINNARTIIGENVRIQNLEYSYLGGKLPENPMWIDGHPTMSFAMRLFSVMVTLVLCTPVLGYYIKFWKRIIHYRNIKPLYGMLVAFLPCLLTFPLIMVHTDQGRWFYNIVFSLFFIVFFIVLADWEIASKAIKDTLLLRPMEFLFALLYFVVFLFPDKQFISIMNLYLFDSIFNLGIV